MGTEQRQRELGKDRTQEGINAIFTFEAVRDWVRRSAAKNSKRASRLYEHANPKPLALETLIYTSGTLGSCACPLSWPGCIQSPAVGLAACKRQPKGSCACQLLPMALPMDMVQRRVRSWCWVLRYLPCRTMQGYTVRAYTAQPRDAWWVLLQPG